MNQEQYIIREYKDSDIPAILDLWEHHSDWGRPDLDEFKRWISTPFGDCMIYVAENVNGEIVGQLYLTPSEIITNNKTKKAVKYSAPIIHQKYRTGNIFEADSPLMKLIINSHQSIVAKGYERMYSFPALGWKRLLQSIHNYGLHPWKVHTFSCIEIGENEKYPCKHELKLIDYFPTEVQQLWSQFRTYNKGLSLFNRDLEWLNYKWGGDLKIGIYSQKGEFEGYAVIRKQTGLLLDFIMLDKKVIPGVLVKMKELFADGMLNKKEDQIPGFKLMLTSYFKDLLQDVNTKEVDYQFVFGLSCLLDNCNTDELDLSKFYIFPLD